MKQMRVLFILLLLMIAAAGFTNPNPEEHREVVRQEVMRYIRKEATQPVGQVQPINQLGTDLGLAIGAVFIERIAAESVHSDNYVLFSITTLQINDEKRNIGVGMFGSVHLFDDLDDALKRLDDRSMVL
jgi:hypothetical protein